MNIFKHIFVVSILTVSCNALGMFVPNTQHVAKKEAELTILFLQYTSEKNQPRFSELLGKGDMRTRDENKELVKIARCASKYRRGLRKQEQQRAIMLSSDPNRRRTL